MSDQTTQADGDVPSRFAVDFSGELLRGIYQVERKLADGGMGSVYLARDTNLGRQVVVKVPHARFLGERGFRTRFKREVTELVRLEHPNIVRILAQGEHDEVPYFVLQYLGGGSLEVRLREATASCAPDDCLSWLRTIAGTLDFIHARDVVHRDVKPDNILFDEVGHVFLSDFGVVKALGEDDLAATAAGTGIGSPKYMAPEQGIGRPITGTADQYGLASTLYEALAGVPPYAAATTIELILKKDREDATPLETHRPDIPPPAAAAVMRGLSRDPGSRFASCRAFADAFVAGLAPAGAPASATTSLFAVADGAGARKRQVRVPLLTLLLTVGVLVGAAFLFGWIGGGQAGKRSEAQVDEKLAVDIALIRPGAEPRRVLRYHPAQGVDDTLRMSVTYKQSFARNGEPQPEVLMPRSTMLVGVHVDELSPAGEALFTWRFLEGVAEADPDADASLAQMTAQVFRQMHGITGSGRVSARGVPAETDAVATTGLPPSAQPFVQNFAMALRKMTVPLPKEPVGIGATWDVTHAMSYMGIHMNQTLHYEILAMHDDVLRLEVQVAVTAPRQDIRRNRDDDSVTTIKDLYSRGGGEMTIDLQRIVPLEGALETSLKLQVSRTLGDSTDMQDAEIVTTTSLKRE